MRVTSQYVQLTTGSLQDGYSLVTESALLRRAGACFLPVGSWTAVPKDVPNPRTREYAALHGKRDFTAVIKLPTLNWGDCPGGPRVSTGPLQTGRGRRAQSQLQQKKRQERRCEGDFPGC